MVIRLFSSTLIGVKSLPIEIEINTLPGLPRFSIVGLASTEIKEAKERVYSAIKSSGFTFPSMKKIINLAPASLPKSSTCFDLGIAYGLLLSDAKRHTKKSGKKIITDLDTERTLFLGELSLNGDVRPVRGVIPSLIMAREEGFTHAVIPKENIEEARIIEGVTILPVSHLAELVSGEFNDVLVDGTMNESSETPRNDKAFLNGVTNETEVGLSVDFSDIKGQEFAKRALKVAAGGGHNITLTGPPGGGKTMLAKACEGILPPLSNEELVEVMSIYSSAGSRIKTSQMRRPFRVVHSSATLLAILGGGQKAVPGELSLAHKGVLFMDELLEFSREKLEALRQPLEQKSILINRLKYTCQYPSDVMLLATYNPCPCGFMGDNLKSCVCRSSDIERYQSKLSGPLKDRIDMQITVPRVSLEDILHDSKDSQQSVEIRNEVIKVRARQRARFAKSKTNSQMSKKQVDAFCKLDKKANLIMKSSIETYNLTMRGYVKVLKVARTIADFDDSDGIKAHHILEALQYRQQA